MKKHSLILSIFVIGIFTIGQVLAEDKFQVKINRYLEVRNISGNVTYQKQQISQPARIGTKLENIGEKINTGSNSSTTLALDTGIGFLEVAENTKMEIKNLQTTKKGGKITHLLVTGGQVRLKLRPFTHNESNLQIETPAGITGVRGTEFGVSVQANGKTGVATLTGSVATSAQGKMVYINKGFQSLIIPGEPPAVPTPLSNDTRLDVRVLAASANKQVRIAGKIDPVNLIILGNKSLTTDRNGRFDILVPLPADRRIAVTVTTPLGKKQDYELAVP